MLKKARAAIRRLGSSTKLQEQGGGGDAPAAAAPPPEPLLPPGLPRASTPAGPQAAPPESPQQQQTAAAQAAPHAAVAAEGGGRPASPQLPAAAPSPGERSLGSPGEPRVDYELVAGPLELDTADAHAAAGPAAEAAAEAAAAAQLAACSLDHQQLSPSGGSVCYGAGGDPGTLGAEEAAAAAAAAAEAALEAGGHSGGHADEGVGHGGSSAAGAAGGSGVGPGGGGGEGISDALAAMMYLTEDGEGGDDCVSVVSDALSDDHDLPDDISELSRALEALEGEALHGSSPGTPSARASGSLDDQLAERLGISPDAADPTAFAQQMAKLYNNLGLKMMERRKHEEALGLLRKAEAVVDNAALWAGAPPAKAHKRDRMRAITFNNLGCLFKRRNMPGLALQYLQKALALEEAGGPVQNSSSTHLNICAALSALKRPKEALAHAERAIILLQRHLWPPHLPFQEGLAALVRALATPHPAAGARQALGSANVLAMAYHNAAVEHEKLGRLREALVSFTRAYLIASKCLGARAQMTTALSRALKAFQQRQARHLPAGAAHAARKAPSLASTRASSSAGQPKRGQSRSSAKASAAASKSSSSLAGKGLASAAASGKATLPLDKGRTTSGASGVGVRPPSSSRLASQLLAAQAQPPPQQP